MATRIIKPAMNGGRISPYLHWRSDLKLFPSSHKEVLNWFPKVEGSVTRRWGSETTITPPQTLGEPAEGFQAVHYDFQYGEQDFDTVILRTGLFPPQVGNPEDFVCAMDIYNRFGDLVASFDSTDIPYLAGQLDGLTFLQQFDALYIYSGDHPTLKLVRTSELNWTLEPHNYLGGPWKQGNGDTTHIISAKVDQWDVATPYAEGDLVITGTVLALTGSSTHVHYRTNTSIPGEDETQWLTTYHYYTRITTSTAPTGIQKGDKIEIQGAVAGGYKSLNGVWTVAEVNLSTSKIDLITGTKFLNGLWFNRYDGNILTAASLYEKGQRQVFHRAKRVNVGVDPTIQPSDDWTAEAFFEGSLTLTATKDTWVATDVGRAYRVASNQTPKVSGKFGTGSQGQSSGVLPVAGQVTLTTEGGVWGGELALQLSLDGGATWDDIGEITSVDGSRNGTITRTITDFNALIRAYMRVRTTASTTDTGCRYSITVADSQYGYFTVTEFISATEVVVATQNAVPSIPVNWRWNAGAFGGLEGYPSCAVILDDAMFVSGVRGSAGIIWNSSLGDYTHWVGGSWIGAAFDISLGKDTRNVVRWMKAKESLLVGTDAGEWTITPRDKEQTLSLLNYKAERQGEYGSANVPALVLADVVVYVERGGFRLRALENSIYDRGVYRSTDISYTVSDWFENDTIKQLAYSRSPIPLVWVLTTGGKLYSWTVDATNGVSAWAEHRIGGSDTIYSVSTTSSERGDALLLTVNNGVSYEVRSVQLGNDILDGASEYTTVDDETFYRYSWGVEAEPVIFDSAYIPASTKYFSRYGAGDDPTIVAPTVFVRLFAAPTNFRILFDGVDEGVEGVDFTRLSGSDDLHVYVHRPHTSFELFDGATPLVDTVDHIWGYGDDCAYLKLTPDTSDGLTWADIEIYYVFSLLTADEYLIQNDNTVLIVGKPLIAYDAYTLEDVRVGTVSMVYGYEYTINAPFSGFTVKGLSATRASRIVVGYEQENLLHPVDLMGDLQLGGCGGIVSVKEVDLVVVESLGLQIRGYDETQENDWTVVADITPQDLVGEALPLFTGLQRVDFSSDTQYNGVDLQIRAQGIRPSTVCSLAVNIERVK